MSSNTQELSRILQQQVPSAWSQPVYQWLDGLIRREQAKQAKKVAEEAAAKTKTPHDLPGQQTPSAVPETPK